MLSWLRKKRISNFAKNIDWLNNLPLDYRQYENQEFNSDFIYQLSRLNAGNLSNSFHWHFSGDPRHKFNHTLLRVIKTKMEEIPILDFFGSFSGKSRTSKSLAQYAQALLILDSNQEFCRNPIRFQTSEDFEINIKNLENRFSKDGISASYFPWSNRYYLINDDRSHTIGAIYRQCLDQNRIYKVKCQLSEWAINKTELQSLLDEFVIFLAAEHINQILFDLYLKTGERYLTAFVGQTNIKIGFLKKSNKYAKEFRELLEKIKAQYNLILFIEDVIP